ncbi:hypothetical protein MSSIT_2404 [Methanosarcina siciliae T4/M]|uniref:DUF11 domain-containing protein n=2 Tax=Methanosarcina siciliae TaxID=38027 RepID=A0A0E3PG97_9EURY|nr:hypothetical protein [Methanosarcina siciliae]AKB29123.1 hypothetical protein MSSIT_2404 [Methanosarcina siciliae T4/M]AKB32978.1 hypothetical protein MSSIH_2288 [Methanosarcina siciliae HI350]
MNKKLSQKRSGKYHFCAVLALFTALFLLSSSLPASANEDDWDNLTVTLGLENSLVSKDGYTLEALKFDGYGMVWIRVSKNDTILEDAVLENNSSGWCYMDNKNLRLKAFNVTDQRNLPMFGSLFSPKAELLFETKKDIEENVILELDLEEDKDEYLLNDEVIVDMELRNTGQVKAEKIGLDLDSDGLLVREGCPEKVTLDKGSKKKCELRFKFPEKVKENYNITVNVNWEDGSGEHFFSDDVEIEVAEPLNIYKNAGSEGFPGSPVYVTVSVKNIQERTVNVRLFDLLPATFTVINISSLEDDSLSSDSSSYLNWEFVLDPEEQKTFSYSISSEQLGAHRVPQAHAYSDLCGQLYTESSDSENIITLYKNISYMPYNNKNLTQVTLSSGADLSSYLDKNGYALLDITVENEALDAFVFIPKGTKLSDNQNEPLKAITITQADELALPGSLYLAGKCYCKLGPDGAEFDPFVRLDLGLNNSIEGNLPSIYCYDETNSTWTLIDSTLNENRISAELTHFSVYAALAEPPTEAELLVKLVN